LTTPATLDPQVLRQWIGRSEVVEDTLDPRQASLMAATLDQETEGLSLGANLPLLWHWIYFLSASRRSRLGRDGHPILGGFLPPVALARRMWAGGRLRFLGALRLGDVARKVSTILNVQVKQGRSGTLCFVTVQHDVSVSGQLRVTEEQDIVYRGEQSATQQTPPESAPTDAEVTEKIDPNSTLLFRYSALTFNGHRIHYDRDYAREVEGYGGLVVHGPLLATLLIDLAGRALRTSEVDRFEFRAVAPLFDTASFTIHARRNGAEVRSWAADNSGRLAMISTAHAVTNVQRKT
jgi:3-methylfumaryl-CoA hydratase